ncbi:hypothetical protein N2W54_001217 [Lotmaria passim]
MRCLALVVAQQLLHLRIFDDFGEVHRQHQVHSRAAELYKVVLHAVLVTAAAHRPPCLDRDVGKHATLLQSPLVRLGCHALPPHPQLLKETVVVQAEALHV